MTGLCPSSYSSNLILGSLQRNPGFCPVCDGERQAGAWQRIAGGEVGWPTLHFGLSPEKT